MTVPRSIADMVKPFSRFESILKKRWTMSKPEVWQRGPVEGVPSLLQPVAHAILESREEVDQILEGFDEKYLWERPAGVASVGFHLQHLAGVLDRLFTYARGKGLSEEQFALLKQEKQQQDTTKAQLLEKFHAQVDQAVAQLRQTGEDTLLDARAVGRAGLPSNVLGLLFHAAEHSMRHTGQLLVTARILMSNAG